MINNTSRQRWQRAAARQLDAQFLNTIIHGLNCSPFEAIRDTVHEVYAPLLETSAGLKPGQLRLSVIDADVAATVPLSQAAQRLVILTLDGGAADRQVRQAGGVIALRRHRLLRVCEEAFQQGGLLTLEGVAELFNCAVRTLVSDLAAVRPGDLAAPALHRQGHGASPEPCQIVTCWLAGQEYSEIARASCHSVLAVANYVEKFKRCAALLGAGFELETVALIARLSPALTRAFVELLAEAQPVAHRQEELAALMKTRPPRRSGRPSNEPARP